MRRLASAFHFMEHGGLLPSVFGVRTRRIIFGVRRLAAACLLEYGSLLPQQREGKPSHLKKIRGGKPPHSKKTKLAGNTSE